MMKKAGCNSMDVGVESGSDRMLKIINKGITRGQILKGIQGIRKQRINFNAFFMIGFPDETEEDVQKTFELMKAPEMGNIILSIFTPYPGTASYRRAVELDLVPSDMDWRLFSHHSPYNHFVKDIPNKRFKEIARDICAYVDRHNNSLAVFIRIHKNEIKFYLRNPFVFQRKFMDKMRRYLETMRRKV
jgi:radical SAM superfamily enzyme YgiQ (UPF0313 family)